VSVDKNKVDGIFLIILSKICGFCGSGFSYGYHWSLLNCPEMRLSLSR